jgi:hypothetical protein
MPQTTSQVNACDVVIKLDDVNGELDDISGSSNECSMDLTNDLGVLTTFGVRFPVRQECKSDATINLKIIYSMDETEALSILRGWYFTTRGHRTIQIDVPDGDVGGDRYTFECFLESLGIPLKSDDPNPILVEAVLKPTGTFTCSEIGS